MKNEFARVLVRKKIGTEMGKAKHSIALNLFQGMGKRIKQRTPCFSMRLWSNSKIFMSKGLICLTSFGSGGTGEIGEADSLYPAIQACGVTERVARGFTLIELLVVVLMIGILAAVMLPQYQIAVEKSRAMEAIAILKSLREAQEAYFMANGKYTSDFSMLDIEIPTDKKWDWSISDSTVYGYRRGKNYGIFFPLQHGLSTDKNIKCGYEEVSATAEQKDFAVKICHALGATGTGPRMVIK